MRERQVRLRALVQALLEPRSCVPCDSVTLSSSLSEGRHRAEGGHALAQHGLLPVGHEGEGQPIVSLCSCQGQIEGCQDPRGSLGIPLAAGRVEEVPEGVPVRCAMAVVGAAPIHRPGDLGTDAQPVGEGVLRAGRGGRHPVLPTARANCELTASTTVASGAIQLPNRPPIAPSVISLARSSSMPL